ncbi:MAG: hypothetical protein EPN20_00320 [Magnetospirillum sp.]|nr:MAG: hypothetical protein EPN20_00320 [Magnetospirillum sp.]
MIRVLTGLGLLVAIPASAGTCLQRPDGLHCSDAGETLILQGATAPTANQTVILQKDGQGNTFGLIGGEKLMIVRAQGMSAAKLGNRRLICVEAGPGITLCK